ncbi:MAG: histidinol-phosphatase HisJ family protein [Helicobacteraceae bacterium]|nr:histidinol-phosphatase HisJ family protein [Helicobacteraceae bacterium]
MKIIDLHNHTNRCNHATGTSREYIEKAIEKKIDIYGFSDHAPMKYDEKYRMSFDQMRSYEDEILGLKNEYKNSIDIKLAYEVDFLPGYMDDRVLNAKVDYLIGSVHFLDSWGFDNPEFIGEYKNRDIDEVWQKYFDQIELLADSGKFDIVGHIDLIKVFKFLPNKSIIDIASSAFESIKRSGMSIEINGAGYRKPVKEAYPSEELLNLAYEMQIPITFGSDAHSVEQVGFYNEDMYSLARRIGYSECSVYTNRSKEMINI